MMNIASKTGFKDWLELYSTYDAEGENTLAKTDTQSDIVLKGFHSTEANQVIDHHTLFPDTAFFVGYKDKETGIIRSMVFHHLFKNTAAGFQFDKDVHDVYALSGFKNGDRVVKIDTSLFDESKEYWFTPTLADFVAASGDKGLFVALESVNEILPDDKNNNKLPNGDPLPYLQRPRKAISVLPFLVSTVGMVADPIMILANVLVKIKQYIEEYLNEEAGEGLWKDSFLMIKQLWFMSQNFEEKINPMLPEDGKIAKRIKIDSIMERQGRAIELMYLGPQVNPTPIPAVGSSTPTIVGIQAPIASATTAVQPVVSNAINEALMQQMVEAVKTSNVIMGEFNKNKNSTNSEGKWEKRFSVDIKQFILYASATSKTLHPEAPNEPYRQLLDDTKVQALSNASQAIINIGGGSQLVDLAKAQMLYNCQQINDTFGAHPKGLSVFFAVPAPVMGSKNSMTGEEYQVRVDTNNLSDAQLMKSISQKVQVPTNVYSFFTTYRNFIIELEYQFGGLSLICENNQRFHDELSMNERVVAIMAASHPNFIASVMAKIDIRNQKFLRSCAKASLLREVDFEALNFYDNINKITLQENLTVTLPVTVHQIIQSASKSPNQKGGGGAKAKRDAIDSEDEDDEVMGATGGDRKAKAAAAKKAKKLLMGVAKNTSPVDASWIKKDKTYSEVFNKHMKTVPKCKGKQICVKFHVTGICNFGQQCMRKNTHNNDFDDKAKREFGAWIKKCRDTADEDN